jgi:hypothetical protein
MRQDSKIRKRLFFTHFFGWVAAAICSHRMTTSLRFGFDDLHAEIARVEATLPSTTSRRRDRGRIDQTYPARTCGSVASIKRALCCGGELHVIVETVSEMLDRVCAASADTNRPCGILIASVWLVSRSRLLDHIELDAGKPAMLAAMSRANKIAETWSSPQQSLRRRVAATG